MSKAPNIPAAVKVLEHSHAQCLLMRDLLSSHEGTIDDTQLRGLAHTFEGLMFDLECALGDLDPA